MITQLALRASLQQKLIGLGMLTSAVSLILCAGLFIFNDIQSFRSTMVNDLTALTRIIGYNAASALEFQDEKSATNTLASLEARPEHVSLHLDRREGIADVVGDASGQQARQREFFGLHKRRLRLVEPPDKLLDSFDCPIGVVYEDPWILVVDKPAGLVAHPVGDFQDETLSNALQSYLDRQTPIRGLLRPGVVHRLDRMTSGLMSCLSDL